MFTEKYYVIKKEFIQQGSKELGLFSSNNATSL